MFRRQRGYPQFGAIRVETAEFGNFRAVEVSAIHLIFQGIVQRLEGGFLETLIGVAVLELLIQCEFAATGQVKVEEPGTAIGRLHGGTGPGGFVGHAQQPVIQVDFPGVKRLVPHAIATKLPHQRGNPFVHRRGGRGLVRRHHFRVDPDDFPVAEREAIVLHRVFFGAQFVVERGRQGGFPVGHAGRLDGSGGAGIRVCRGIAGRKHKGTGEQAH